MMASMSRREFALACIDLTKGIGLELGPLYNPVVTKDEANIRYLDHMSYDDLKKKYGKDPGVPLDQLVPIDYVLKDNSLQKTFKGKTFDYVIACHVIEHIPDMVHWLRDVATILNEGGVLSLVIPDKRYTFDLHRNESRPADIIGAYLDKQVKVNSTQLYDDVMTYRHDIDPAVIWRNPTAYADLPAYNTGAAGIKKAMMRCETNLKLGEYVDCHCHVLTPASFFEIVRTLIAHDLFDYKVAHFSDTPAGRHEFYVSLKKTKASQKVKLTSVPDIPKPPTVKELEAQVQQLQARLQAFEQSTSWRVTKPLRAVSRKLKKL